MGEERAEIKKGKRGEEKGSREKESGNCKKERKEKGWRGGGSKEKGINQKKKSEDNDNG